MLEPLFELVEVVELDELGENESDSDGMGSVESAILSLEDVTDGLFDWLAKLSSVSPGVAVSMVKLGRRRRPIVAGDDLTLEARDSPGGFSIKGKVGSVLRNHAPDFFHISRVSEQILQ